MTSFHPEDLFAAFYDFAFQGCSELFLGVADRSGRDVLLQGLAVYDL